MITRLVKLTLLGILAGGCGGAEDASTETRWPTSGSLVSVELEQPRLRARPEVEPPEPFVGDFRIARSHLIGDIGDVHFVDDATLQRGYYSAEGDTDIVELVAGGSEDGWAVMGIVLAQGG